MKQLLARVLVVVFSLNLFCMLMVEVPHTHAINISEHHQHEEAPHHDSQKSKCVGCTDALLSILSTNTDKKDISEVPFLTISWVSYTVLSGQELGILPFIPHAPPWPLQLTKVLESTRLLL